MAKASKVDSNITCSSASQIITYILLFKVIDYTYIF